MILRLEYLYNFYALIVKMFLSFLIYFYFWFQNDIGSKSSIMKGDDLYAVHDFDIDLTIQLPI